MSNETVILVCSKCGAKNRVSRLYSKGAVPVCGKCKTQLGSAGGRAAILTDATFEHEIGRSHLPFLVDMWSPGCGPCRTIAPIIEQLAEELEGRVNVGKLNVDDNPYTASRLSVHGIPTLILFSGGREVDRIVGAASKQDLLRWITSKVS